MASPAVDPKAAPLADDLKELALSLPTTVFPKAFFCALCSALAVDAYKLLCCNKAICTPCQSKLVFPTTCPSCDHSPLEADSCTPNKSLRNTMRIWLQKQKKKEEAKAAAAAATPPADTTPVAAEVQPAVDAADKPVDSIEVAPKGEDESSEQLPTGADNSGDVERAGSTAAPANKDPTPPMDDNADRRASVTSQNAAQSAEPSAADSTTNENTNAADAASTTNGTPGQMGFGFPNQGNFNGMGFNGMGQMNGMANMMGNGNWNGMNPMEFSMNNMNGMSNGMYGNFGGNMGMGMSDMSAMNMMNYGGGYGNGWNGMGSGYGNFNGFNQMAGYNQSGAYPEMMNQFPKNNFQNQNQNRFPASQGGALPQQNNRNGSQGGSVSGSGSGLQQNANSRPGSRSGPAQSRDGQSPSEAAQPASETKVDGGELNTSAESTEEGLANAESAQGAVPSGDAPAGSGSGPEGDSEMGKSAGGDTNEAAQSNGLNQIQTVDTGDGDMQQNFGPAMMANGMQPNMGFPHGMMNQFPNPAFMNAPFDPTMNMGFHQGNNFGPRGGFNAAYGAATVLTGEPQGRGVEGAPTGPRAMREGRPNTGFSSRMNNVRYNPPPKSITPAKENAPRSPQRRVRSRSPLRDEALRVKDKSVSRSRSRSKPRVKDEEKSDHRDRSRSADRQSRRADRGRSPTPPVDDDHERRKERRHHRSARDDDRDGNHEDRRGDEKESRGDRTRSASADSKYRSSRRDKDKHRSSRSHRDRSREHRRRHRSRSPVGEDRYEDEDTYTNNGRESESSSRRKHRADKDKQRDRDRSRDRERDRDRRDRKDRDKDYDYERESDRSRDKTKDRSRRRERDAEDDERVHDDDRYRSSRRSRKDRDREERDQEDRDNSRPKRSIEEDVVGKMMQRRPASPPLNAPTGPSANTFSIKGAGRPKPAAMPPPQPPTGPRSFQPPKGPSADRDRERDRHRRKGSVSSVHSASATPAELSKQDHYAAEREKNARERNSRDRVDRDNRDSLTKSLHSRVHSSSSRPSPSSKRSRDDEEFDTENIPRGPSRSDVKAPTGPATHRDKRRKSGAGGDNSIANLFTAGLRKNAGKSRRGGVRTEGDVDRELERVERERDRR